MMNRRELLLLAGTLRLRGAQSDELRSVVLRYLDSALRSDGGVASFKGKDGASLAAMAFEIAYGLDRSRRRYRTAALELADRVLEEMKASPCGVLGIKEKRGEKILGGGPPAFGWYVSSLGHIFHRAGGRAADLQYLASVLDRYPWNPEGWWAPTVDVRDGKPLVDLDKPSPVNKNCAMAMAAAMVSQQIRALDGELSAKLRAKALKCLQTQIVPAQTAEGFWHYGLTGRDPKNKDVIGYFMLSAGLLIRLRTFAPSCADAPLIAAIRKAESHAAQHSSEWLKEFSDEPRRLFDLALMFRDGGHTGEAEIALKTALEHFPHTDRGQDGGRSVNDAAMMLLGSA